MNFWLLAFYLYIQSPIQILGFTDFCYDNICYSNPSAAIAARFGGRAITIEDADVLDLGLLPTVGIGLAPQATRARIDSRALGLSSRVYGGGDAGTFACGVLLYRALQANDCSLFVHVPPIPNEQDIDTVENAIELTRHCVKLR